MLPPRTGLRRRWRPGDGCVQEQQRTLHRRECAARRSDHAPSRAEEHLGRAINDAREVREVNEAVHKLKFIITVYR